MQIKEKIINGKTYKYARKTIRLPDGKVKKIEKIIQKQSKKELEKILEEKELEENTKHMLQNFKTNSIFTKEEFTKIEKIRLEYKKLLRKLPKENIKDILDRFTANFTYESNALEGNSLTLKDVAMVLFEKTTIKGKELREVYEARNSREVVEKIFNNEFDISQEDIKKIHKLLMKDIDTRTGYKKFPNIILGKRVKTTPPEKVENAMAELINWYKTNKEKMHPIELSSVFHGKFEQIHPFEDGNGRVGRFLMNVMLIKNKYPPLIIRNSQRIKYLKTLEAFDNNYQDLLKRFILQKFKDAYKKFFEVYIKYI